MVNRVTTKLNDGTYGLFISKPGVDVLTAAPRDMIFDTRFAHSGSVIVQGSATRGSTVNFPTQAFVPMVVVSLLDGSGNSIGWKYYSSAVEPIIEGGTDTGYDYVKKKLIEPIYRVTTSQLIFDSSYTSRFDPSGGYTCYYAVLRIPGGA